MTRVSDVTVVIPSTKRPDQFKRCLSQLLYTAPDIEIVAVIPEDDKETREVAERFITVKIVDQDPDGLAIDAWNRGAAHATGDFLVTGADDVCFYEGWCEAALEAMDKVGRYGMVGLNTMDKFGDKLATHYMVARSYAVYEWGGVLFFPYYKHFFSDNEATARAQRDKKYYWAADAVVEHNHWVWGKAEKDEIYDRTDGLDKEDKETFLARAAEGFPNKHKPAFGPKITGRDGFGTVAVGVRVYKAPEPEFFSCWTKFIGNGLAHGDRVFEPVTGVPGHVASNHLARALLSTVNDSILFVDDDMAFAPDALAALRSNAESQDYDVVSAFATHRTIPPHAVVMRLLEEQPSVPVSILGEQYGTLRDIEDNAIVDVDAVGLAFTLVKRHVIEAMLNEYGALYTSWFNWGEHTEGEDIRFSRRCRELGFKLAIDTNVKIGHIGRYTFGWDDHQRWLNSQEKNDG